MILWQRRPNGRKFHAYDRPLHRDAAHELVSLCRKAAIAFGHSIQAKPVAKRDRCVKCSEAAERLSRASGGIDLW